MRWRVALVLLLLALPRPARGAPPTATSASPDHPRYHVPVAFARYAYFGDAEVPADCAACGDLHLDGHALRVGLQGGHRLTGPRLILTGAIDYDLAVVTASGAGRQDEAALHALQARVGAIKQLAGGWGLLVFVRMGVASDFTDAAWTDLRASTGAGVVHFWGPDLRLTVGFTYSNNFIGELVLPLVHLQLNRGPLRLTLMIPRGAALWVELGPRFEVGLEAQAVALRFGLHRRDRFTDEYSQLNVTAGPAARLTLLRGTFVTAQGGYNVRYYRLKSGQEETHSLLTFAGGFAALTLGYMY